MWCGLYILAVVMLAVAMSVDDFVIARYPDIILQLQSEPIHAMRVLSIPPPVSMPSYVSNHSLTMYMQHIVDGLRDYREFQDWAGRVTLSASYTNEKYYMWLTFTLQSRVCPVPNGNAAVTVCM